MVVLLLNKIRCVLSDFKMFFEYGICIRYLYAPQGAFLFQE